MNMMLTDRERRILYGDMPATKTAPPAAPETDERQVLGFEIKSFSTELREIEGIASTSHRDLGGDVVQIPGAFSKTILERGPGGVEFRVGHDMAALPIGSVLALEERSEGLFMRAKVFATSAGDDLLTTIRELRAAGKSTGLSIGYAIRPGGAQHDRVNGKLVRRLTDLDLREISVTTTPMNTNATITSVKAVAEPPTTDDSLDLVRFFERAETESALAAITAEHELLDGPPVDRKRRLVRGYPIVWGFADVNETRDKIDPDAFTPQIAEGLIGLPLLVNHEKTAGEIGRLAAIEADDVGLLCVWRIHDDDQFPRGTELLETLQHDMENGTFAPLSAAYKVKNHTTDRDGTSRLVTWAQLSEVSLLLGQRPAQPEAAVSARRKSVAQLKAELESSQEWLWKLEMAERDQQRRDHAFYEDELRKADSFLKNPPAHVQKARADEKLAEALRALAVDDRQQIKTVDAAESQRLGDWEFKRSWDRQHPGGGDHCPCRAHRLWRGEAEIGVL